MNPVAWRSYLMRRILNNDSVQWNDLTTLMMEKYAKNKRKSERARVYVCMYVCANERGGKRNLEWHNIESNWRVVDAAIEKFQTLIQNTLFLPKMSNGNADNLKAEWMTRRVIERESEHIFTKKQQLCEYKKTPALGERMNEWMNERSCEQQVNDSDIGPRYENRCVFIELSPFKLRTQSSRTNLTISKLNGCNVPHKHTHTHKYSSVATTQTFAHITFANGLY